MKRKGFTLIELLLVIAIISILAFVLLPKGTIGKLKAKETGITQNMNTVQGYLHANPEHGMINLLTDKEFKDMRNPLDKTQCGVGVWKDRGKCAVIICKVPEQTMFLQKGQIGVFMCKAFKGTRDKMYTLANLDNPTPPSSSANFLGNDSNTTGTSNATSKPLAKSQYTRIGDGHCRVESKNSNGVYVLATHVDDELVNRYTLPKEGRECTEFTIKGTSKYEGSAFCPSMVDEFADKVKKLNFEGDKMMCAWDVDGFGKCTNLEEVNVNCKTYNLDGIMFDGCRNLKTIKIMPGCTYVILDTRNFENTGVKTIEIPVGCEVQLDGKITANSNPIEDKIKSQIRTSTDKAYTIRVKD